MSKVVVIGPLPAGGLPATARERAAFNAEIEALDYLLTRIRQADPAKADVREAILSAAWAGLPGWRS